MDDKRRGERKLGFVINEEFIRCQCHQTKGNELTRLYRPASPSVQRCATTYRFETSLNVADRNFHHDGTSNRVPVLRIGESCNVNAKVPWSMCKEARRPSLAAKLLIVSQIT